MAVQHDPIRKKTLRSLCAALTVSDMVPRESWAQYSAYYITDLCFNSRNAVGGTAFFCLVGKSADGHDYASAAYRSGCRVFFVERRIDLPADAFRIVVPNTRAALADCAAEFYDHPERAIRLIGLTGTKGKTTTAILIRDLLCASGMPAGYIGTNGVDFAGEHYDTVNSTPESMDIYRYLRKMASAGVKACVMEISSQALWMKRVRGLTFDTTLFTNLSRDHIGGVEHPDMTHYRASKKKLFSDYPARMVVVNRDDEASAYMAEDLPGGENAPQLLTFSVPPLCMETIIEADESEDEAPLPPDPLPPARWTARDIRPVMRGSSIGVEFLCLRDGIMMGEPWFLPLPGAFNVHNALAALTVACERFGVSPEAARECLARAVVPGRFETMVHPCVPDVIFVIDYAHNGISLTSILDALRAYEPRRLIALFGSVGERSLERRRDLAEAAGPRCDLCIITSDNPGAEPPEGILAEIDRAFPAGSCPRRLIEDRGEAIRAAVDLCEPGDIILLAGKGHENYQRIGTQKVPFSEIGILREALEKKAALTV